MAWVVGVTVHVKRRTEGARLRYGLLASTILACGPCYYRPNCEAIRVNVKFGVANTLVVLSLLTICHAQTESDLGKQMEALHVHTALLIRSQEMDDLPAWSPDGRFLAVELAGKWVKVDVSSVQLQEAKWHDQRVGVQTKAVRVPHVQAFVDKLADGERREPADCPRHASVDEPEHAGSLHPRLQGGQA